MSCKESNRVSDEDLQELQEESARCEERNYDKLQYSNSAQKELNRCLAWNELIDAGADVKAYSDGEALVGGRFVYALFSGKWRSKGKAKWYHSKSPSDFVARYVNA